MPKDVGGWLRAEHRLAVAGEWRAGVDGAA